MKRINFKRAYYIKLGRSGIWEDEIINGNKVRIGYTIIDLSDIHNNNWSVIKKRIEEEYSERGKKTGAAQDANALINFCDANEEDVFITFYGGKLFWCIPDNSPIQQDSISKFRTTKSNWTCTDVFGKTLYTNQISGKISKTQGFRATLCKVKELETLKRIINGEVNPVVQKISNKRKELIKIIEDAMTHLHWKDMEVLADLIFRQSGWRRISMVGESMKYVDIELEDPITKEIYQVQVKAKAGVQHFIDYAEKFQEMDYRKLFFVAFDADNALKKYQHPYDTIQLLTSFELAELILDLGLTNWVAQKIA